MTYFGIIWLLINSAALAMGYKAQFLLLLFSCVLQANAVFNSPEFPYGVPALFVAVFICIRYLVTNRSDTFIVQRVRDRVLQRLWIFFLYSSILTIFSAGFLFKGTLVYTSGILQTAKWYHLRISFRALYLIAVYNIYLFTAYVIMVHCREIDDRTLTKTIEFISVFVIAIGCIQYFEKRFGLSFPPMEYFIYSNKNSNCYYDNVVRFYSTFLEPSYTSVFFAGLFWFRLAQPRRYNLIVTFGLFGGLLISLGMTGYGAFAIGLVVFLIFNRNFKALVIYLGLAVVALIGLFLTGYMGIMFKTLMSKQLSVTRFAWNRLALQLLGTTKGIGVGFGVARANSLIYNVLVKTGVIGFVLYIAARLTEFRDLLKLRKVNTAFFGVFMYAVTVFAGQSIADPDLEFEVFWFGIFLYAIMRHNGSFIGEDNEEAVRVPEGCPGLSQKC